MCYRKLLERKSKRSGRALAPRDNLKAVDLGKGNSRTMRRLERWTLRRSAALVGGRQCVSVREESPVVEAVALPHSEPARVRSRGTRSGQAVILRAVAGAERLSAKLALANAAAAEKRAERRKTPKVSKKALGYGHVLMRLEKRKKARQERWQEEINKEKTRREAEKVAVAPPSEEDLFRLETEALEAYSKLPFVGRGGACDCGLLLAYWNRDGPTRLPSGPCRGCGGSYLTPMELWGRDIYRNEHKPLARRKVHVPRPWPKSWTPTLSNAGVLGSIALREEKDL